MMKSCIAAFFGLALFCGAAFAAEDKITVWFDAGGSPGESYATVLQNGAQQAADDLGIEIKFVYSDWNAEKMITNFRQGMATNPDGMVVIGAPGDDAYMPLIGEAIGKGIQVMCVDTPLPKTFERYQSKGYSYIGVDNYGQGKMLAERSLAHFGLKKGDKVLVWGLKSVPGRGLRAQALVDVYTNVGLDVDYLEISPEANKEATLGAPILTGYIAAHKDCKLIVIDHGALTAQAGTALRSAGIKPGTVGIAGFSLSPATAEAIKSGYVGLVSEGQPYMMAYLAVNQIVLNKRGSFGGIYVDTAGGFVTKDNIDQIAPLAEKAIR